MKIRNLEASDRRFLEEWHKRSGFDYQCPDFTGKEFESVGMLVDENGTPRQLIAARRTTEIYVLLDPTWRNPRWRLEGLTQLIAWMRGQLERLGYSDGHAWIPPQVEKSFGRKLVRIFGCVKSAWASYTCPVRVKSNV